CHQYLSSRTF
nr:immunoglobulin light chain junction region [Mus musculus]